MRLKQHRRDVKLLREVNKDFGPLINIEVIADRYQRVILAMEEELVGLRRFSKRERAVLRDAEVLK